MSTHNIPFSIFFNIKLKIALNFQIRSYGIFFQGTQTRVRNSRGKRAISVRATEVLLYCVVFGQKVVYIYCEIFSFDIYIWCKQSFIDKL